MDAKYITPEMLVARWGGAITIGGLALWRSRGQGPRFVKIGRKVAYAISEIERYEVEVLRPMCDPNKPA